MKKTTGWQRGFTLIELLVVIAIIGILAVIIIPSIRGALKSAKKARTMSQIQDLDGALKRYFAEYGKMPVPAGQNGGPDRLFRGKTQAAVVEVLIGANTNLNPKQIVFLDLDPASFKDMSNGKPMKTMVEVQNALAQGNPYKDPWWDLDKGNDVGDYVIMMDLNFDGKITDFGYGELRAKVAVCSGGEDDELKDPPFRTW